MYRKLSKLGAVKTERNWSRSERNVGVSCMGGLLVARVPGCCATPRIPPGRKEVAIPHAYLAPGKGRNPNLGDPVLAEPIEHPLPPVLGLGLAVGRPVVGVEAVG